MQLGLAAHSDQIWACEKVGMLAMIDGKYSARLGMPRSSADELRRSLLSCSPRSMSAPRMMLSAFESEWGTVFDAQSSLAVVYDKFNPSNDTQTQRDAQEALQRSQCTRNVKIVINLPTYAWTLSVAVSKV